METKMEATKWEDRKSNLRGSMGRFLRLLPQPLEARCERTASRPGSQSVLLHMQRGIRFHAFSRALLLRARNGSRSGGIVTMRPARWNAEKRRRKNPNGLVQMNDPCL